MVDLKNIDRFLDRIVIGNDDECWAWGGSVQGRGYGKITLYPGGTFLAHRLSYLYFVGDIPSGSFVCHACDTPLCVRPSHLFLGTHQDNMTDMVRKGRSIRGEGIAGARLTEAQVKSIKVFLLEGRYSHIELANLYGIDSSLISKIHTGRAWRWVTI